MVEAESAQAVAVERQAAALTDPADSAPVIVAGGERIAVLRTNRSVVILDGSGRPLRAIPIRRGAVHGAALDRDQLVLLRRAAIEASASVPDGCAIAERSTRIRGCA